jgi:hypothetical protein
MILRQKRREAAIELSRNIFCFVQKNRRCGSKKKEKEKEKKRDEREICRKWI